MVWQLLLKPLMGVAGDAVKGFVETKKLKTETKLTEIKANKKRLEDIASGKIKWEQSAVDQMKGSWTDELVLLALMIPAICAFIPFMQPHIETGLATLETMPKYYTHLLYMACSVSLGYRAAPGVMGLFGKKK